MNWSKMRAQSAMEYLMTYGWAMLIIAVVLSALYVLGLFSPNTYVSSQCIFPAQLSCISSSLTTTGLLSINLEQAFTSPINVTAIGCNTNATIAYMTNEKTQIAIGGNATFTGIQCYTGSVPYSNKLGSLYTGYIILNYTNTQTGFPQTAIATLLQKVTS